jgi:hypothetical protein
MFTEFFQGNSADPCHSFCGNSTTISGGDSMYFEIGYFGSPSNYWLVYSQDTTASTYQVSYVHYGTGAKETTLTSLKVADVEMEGYESDSSTYYPSGPVTFSNVIGEDTSSNFQLGSVSTTLLSPSGTSTDLSVSLSHSSGSCDVGSNVETCGTVSITS